MLLSFGLSAACGSTVPVAEDGSLESGFTRLQELYRFVRPGAVSRTAVGEVAFQHVRVSDYENGPSDNLAVTPTGELLRYAEARRRAGGRHFAKWGALSRDLASEIGRGESLGGQDLMLFWDPLSVDPRQLGSVLSSYGDSIVVRSQPHIARIRIRDADALLALAQHPSVRMIHAANRNGMSPASVSYTNSISPSYLESVPSSAVTSGTYHTFYPDPFSVSSSTYHGEGVRVGFVEALGLYDFDDLSHLAGSGLPEDETYGCVVWEDHEAFDEAPNITYQSDRPIPCNGESDCTQLCGLLADVCLPVARFGTVSGYDGYCIDAHLTKVASRVASNVRDDGGRPHHAAKVSMYVANGLHPSMSGGIDTEDDDLEVVYDWLLGEGVKIVNESISWGRRGETDDHDILVDWYARYKGLIVHKAAGNPDTALHQEHADCTSYNDICVGGSEWKGNGGAPNNVGDHKYSNPRYKNPYVFGGERREQEKPDVVAESYPAEHTAQVSAGSEEIWEIQDGTSFGTPVVTGVTALLEGQCLDTSSSGRSNLWYRSLYRTLGTWNLSPYEKAVSTCATGTPAYPAPHFVDSGTMELCDYRGGAGALFAQWFGDERTCNPNPGGISGGPVSGTLDGTATPTDPGTGGSWVSVDGLADLAEPTESTGRGNSTGLPLRAGGQAQAAMLWQFDSVGSGSRIRSTFSYQSCPDMSYRDMTGVPFDGIRPAVNLDLAVLAKTASGDPAWIFAAEALHETNEGFDVTTQTDYEWVRIYMISPQLSDWDDCPDANGVNATKSEPWVAWYART